jgi:hypothetical protein
MGKELKIIDLNIFSGSNEVFRTAVGGYYEIVSGTYGEQVDAVEYDEDNILSPYISEIEVNPDFRETISDAVIIPNYKFPVRVIGNADNIENDNFWKLVFTGGTFGTKDVEGVYTDSTFDKLPFEYELPYSQQEANYIPGGIIADPIQLSYEYNFYIEEYEDYIDDFDSELLIPNMYFLRMFQFNYDRGPFLTPYEINDTIEDFVTLEDEVLVPETLLFGSSMRRYLSSSIIRNTLSQSLKDDVNNILQNIMFDEDYFTNSENLYTEMITSKGAYPYYIKFDFETNKPDSSDFVESITNNEFSQRFLKTLKETFSDELVTPAQDMYHVETTFLSGSEDITTYSTVIEGESTEIRTADFMEMLMYSYNNFLSTTDNCYYMGEETEDRKAMFDTIGTYRYNNSISSLGVLNDTVDFLNDNFDISSISDLYNLDSRHNETLAYRVEKIGGAGTGDSLTQNVLQNFWFFNSNDVSNLDFLDSQVKYDEDYTYNIYAYVLVVGCKYSFSDLRLTRQIGDAIKEISDSSTTYNIYNIGDNCLEFYDPATDETADQIYGLSCTTDSDCSPASGVCKSGKCTGLENYNQFASNAQITSDNQYMADFYVNYEPTIKIKEIPVFSKTLRVMDNPGNLLNVHPYQYMDDSRRIGFLLRKTVFNDEINYPSVITDYDNLNRTYYLNANDLLVTDLLINDTVSEERYVEIYRIDERPTALSDFDGNLIQVLDLKMPDIKNTYSTIDFSDRIKTNKKYYYLFRITSEHRMQSQLSEIYEAQLINDGGYTYSIFNVIFEDELEEETFTSPSRSFKKLFQLQPNQSQLAFNYDNVDFLDTAISQLENLSVGKAGDLIWDKTFKIRLTSKKTGRKIDLNITYDLQRE